MNRVLACLFGATLLASATAAHADKAIIVLDASGRSVARVPVRW